MMDLILDLFFPRRSLEGRSGTWMTDAERRRMCAGGILLEEPELRARGIMHLDTLVAACRYDDSVILQTALRRFKYGGVRGLGAELAALLTGVTHLLPAGDQVFSPVPLHWRRRYGRGFNQSLVLARIVALHAGSDMRLLLRRKRSTGQQARRSRTERLAAMRDAFAVTGNDLPKHVVLVDDVATTCATLDACACTLKRAGVSRVDAIVIALG